ncbi:hypothetical protein VTG60DRAFT_5240 [Thermothelomyces hinnuleus]
MKPFTLTLANGATLTGLANLPETLPTGPKFKPLMQWAGRPVGGHRPARLQGLDVLLPDPPGRSSYQEMLGGWLHREILPALWRRFGEPRGTCDEAIYGHTARLNEAFPAREREDALTTYMPRFRDGLAARVRVPVRVGLAERDGFWRGDEEHLRELVAAFVASPQGRGHPPPRGAAQPRDEPLGAGVVRALLRLRLGVRRVVPHRAG